MAAVTLIVTLSATGASAAEAEHSAPNGVAHRSGQAHLRQRTVSPDGSDTSQAYLLGHASGVGSATVGPRSDCRDARRGLSYYIRRYVTYRHKMGAGRQGSLIEAPNPAGACPHIRRAAKLWRSRAHRAHAAYEAWSYQWEWQRWLPDKFRRVGHCETGSTPGGTAAGNWRWDSGRYVSAFGIYRPAYESYHRWTGRNTPREQYEVAAAIQARFGWGAWGCGGA